MNRKLRVLIAFLHILGRLQPAKSHASGCAIQNLIRRSERESSVILICMRVKVLLFGQLKDIVGREEDSLDLEPGARLTAVMAHYAQRYPKFQGLTSSIACSINQEYAPGTTVLREGDEIGLLPPVSGGRA